MAKKPFKEGYDILKGAMEIWQDDDGTVYVGPYEGEKGEFNFEAFVRQTYPDAHIEFTTPRLKKDVRAQREAQKKADVQAEITAKEAELRSLKGKHSAGRVMVLIREKEALQKKLAGM